MFEVDVYEAVEGRIMEELAFGHLLAEHLPVVGLRYLLDDVALG